MTGKPAKVEPVKRWDKWVACRVWWEWECSGGVEGWVEEWEPIEGSPTFDTEAECAARIAERRDDANRR